MESLDLELELNALHYNAHFDSDFDSTTDIHELTERIIERSNPKPAKLKRGVSDRLDSIVVGTLYEMPKRGDIRYLPERW